jgi:light-regulated signal transduction histidine kinase (bacteriophytochrome)
VEAHGLAAFQGEGAARHAVSLVGTVEDVTERKRAEDERLRLNEELERRVRERTAQLSAANQELTAFAYSVSHDLRAPLRGIDGWSLALLEDCADRLDDTGRQYLGRVRSEAQRMGRLIDDLLALSRVTRAEMRTEPVDLSALAEAILGRLRTAYPDRQAEVVVQPDLFARGDPTLLEQALTNLLENASKFSAARSPARIELGRTDVDGRSAFYVRDNGAGFDMAYSDKLFGAFQRLHRSSEFSGTGVGLATVQRIVHRHGGEVWAEAKVGEGASFYFTLGEDA